MKLYSWNVNGLRACMTKGFAEFLQEAAPDIICLQETKMQPHQADVPLEGYHQFWNSAEKKGYSGTALFMRSIGTVRSARATAVQLFLRRLSLWLLPMAWARRSTIRKGV